MTMVNNPYDYGVQLLPEAETLLVDTYGTGQGLAINEQKRSYSHANKNKPNRLYVCVNDELKNRLEDLKMKMHFKTDQDMLEAALWAFCDRATWHQSQQRNLRQNIFGVGGAR